MYKYKIHTINDVSTSIQIPFRIFPMKYANLRKKILLTQEFYKWRWQAALSCTVLFKNGRRNNDRLTQPFHTCVWLFVLYWNENMNNLLAKLYIVNETTQELSFVRIANRDLLVHVFDGIHVCTCRSKMAIPTMTFTKWILWHCFAKYLGAIISKTFLIT